ncbi:hypothetical protein SUDANB105_08184 (plasmid) [Streptomyces sp. enrichment culture]|uniref:hypothetical protein n=1 Tax=Streptomyces sp. enrichment culture TaxID=1795815 RepID=UPI003F5511D5
MNETKPQKRETPLTYPVKSILAGTHDEARRLHDFRAAQPAEVLGISLPEADNRLKRLVEAGALRRERAAAPERGGKEFTYRLPRADRDR